jgi:hypothetical protein
VGICHVGINGVLLGFSVLSLKHYLPLKRPIFHSTFSPLGDDFFWRLIVLDFKDFGGCSGHEFEVIVEEPEALFGVGDFVFLGQFDVLGPLVVHHQRRLDTEN